MNTTSLENITSLLCEVEEVSEQLQVENKKLEISKLIDNVSYLYDRITEVENGLDVNELVKMKNQVIEFLEEQNIGNPIEYHHLMMYCEEKDLPFCISGDYLFTFPDFKEFTLKSKLEIIAKIDYTKPLHQQSEETLGKIFNFLKG